MGPNQSERTFDAMAKELISHLKHLGYSATTIAKYLRSIKKIRNFIEKENIEQYTSEICRMYILNILGNKTYQFLSRTEKDEIRCANVILEYQINSTIYFRTVLKDKTLYGAIGETISDYLSYRESKYISKRTREDNRHYLQRFQDYLEQHNIKDINNLTQTTILNYVKSLGFYSTCTIYCTLCALRGFLRFLHHDGITDIDWSYLVPKGNYKKEAKLPTTYTKDEIERILNAIDRGNPKGKRDYTMVLFAARLGLRASDICGLKFENLMWEQSIVSLRQKKTLKNIELPLLSEIGDAIIVYLKHGRPKSELPYVFLHINPSYEKLQEPTLHKIVTTYMKRAGISDIDKKKHGPHALRHSLAGFLLENNTPLPIISEVLGHTNTESTKTYLRIDLNSLRQCALEVPALNTSVYEGEVNING